MIQLASATAAVDTGREMYELIADLYPIWRSITGEGVRRTLAKIAARIPLEVHEVPSGTKVLDWTVPREWNIRDAYIKNAGGERIVDWRQNPLHVLGYSVPVKGRFSLEELMPHLYSAPQYPEWIPFRYSYYNENWGFCLPHNQLERLEDGEYEVCIDSTLEDGSLTYGECFLPGESTDEVLISAHVDHPAMCNDNLSGIAVATFLAESLARRENRRLSYRFIFIPTTIGSITWLARNEHRVGHIKHGFTITCVGDEGGFTWKETRRGNMPIDRAMKVAMKESGERFQFREFSPFGFDERQFCSPGFNLPVGSLLRTPAHDYPENHTSADNLDIMVPEKLEGSLRLCENALAILEGDAKYLNTQPYAEPQLGKRGIYRKIGGPIPDQSLIHLFWVLNYSDGGHSLLDIAEKSGFRFADIRRAADILFECDLLAPHDATATTVLA